LIENEHLGWGREPLLRLIKQSLSTFCLLSEVDQGEWKVGLPSRHDERNLTLDEPLSIKRRQRQEDERDAWTEGRPHQFQVLLGLGWSWPFSASTQQERVFPAKQIGSMEFVSLVEEDRKAFRGFWVQRRDDGACSDLVQILRQQQHGRLHVIT
jgi:hypothetical protein